MASLGELNERWRETGKVHAAGEGEQRFWSCPICGQHGQTRMPLVGAMSAALAHKNHCSAVS
jgi:hypothetical protein